MIIILKEILKRRQDKLICTIFKKETVTGADIFHIIDRGLGVLGAVLGYSLWAYIICFFIGSFVGIVCMMFVPLDPQITDTTTIIILRNLMDISTAGGLFWKMPTMGALGCIVVAIIFIVLCVFVMLCQYIVKRISEVKLAEYHGKKE